MRILLAGGVVCPFDSSQRCITNGYVGIEEERIAFVSEGLPAGFEPDRVIDCQGCLITPGFVDCHTHLAENLFKGLMEEIDFEGLFYTTLFHWESLIDPEMVYWGSMAGALDALSCGVTTIADMYHHASAIAEAVSDVGIRAYIGQKILGFPLRKPPSQAEYGIDYNFDFPAFSRQLEEAVRFASTWRRSAQGRVTTCIAPHATNTLNREMFIEIAERAAAEGLSVHLHLAQMASERDAVQARDGMGCVEFLEDVGLLERPVLGAHAIFVDDKEIQILHRHDVSISHNPVPNARDAATIAPVSRMRERGIKVGLGTDAFEMNMLQTARFAALVNRIQTGDPSYLTAYDALAMATIDGAAALGMDDEIGSLEEGKRADLIVFDLRHLNTEPAREPVKNILYYGDASNIRIVFVDGKTVLENGEFMSADVTAVERGFNRACAKLEDRINCAGEHDR